MNHPDSLTHTTWTADGALSGSDAISETTHHPELDHHKMTRRSFGRPPTEGNLTKLILG